LTGLCAGLVHPVEQIHLGQVETDLRAAPLGCLPPVEQRPGQGNSVPDLGV
jgi:hypothetical protein